MAAQLRKTQLKLLCTTAEVLEKAQSILRLASARTGQGTGFVVNPAFLPAVCAYLAAEQLNSNEVTLKAAALSACLSQHEFTTIAKTVRTALHTSDTGSRYSQETTYETLVDVYRIVPRDEAIAWMEDAEGRLPSRNLLRQRYGKNGVLCAVFYWVCQLMEDYAVQAKQLCQAYGGVTLTAFKAIVKTIDSHCDPVADIIKSQLPKLRKSALPSTSTSTTSNRFPISPIKSPTKSPTKSAMKKAHANAGGSMSTSELTPSKKASSHLKRGVVFLQDGPDEDTNMDDGNSFPETPTKRRRIEHARSPNKARASSTASSSPTKRQGAVESELTTAFHEALKGGISSQDTGPSTPRRTRIHPTTPYSMEAEVNNGNSQSASVPPSPRRRGNKHRRFLPVFVDQQQWFARDPKVERIWKDAEAHKNKMLELYDHPFDKYRSNEQRMGVVG